MDEEAAKECGEEAEPNATEEATSPTRAAPIDVAETSTPRAQLVRPLMLLKWTNRRRRLYLLIPRPLNSILRYILLFGMLYVENISFLLFLAN